MACLFPREAPHLQEDVMGKDEIKVSQMPALTGGVDF
jgi:hypothetical protein